MNVQTRKAFTLIELLIVVALIAIMAASSLAFIVVPPHEQAQATTDLATEQGLASFFVKLVADAHNATSLTLAQGGQALLFKESGSESNALYFIDGKERLRRGLLTSQEAEAWRKSPASGRDEARAGMLLEKAGRLEAKPLECEGLWRIGVRLAAGDPREPALERSVELALGRLAAQSGGMRAKSEQTRKNKRQAQ